MFTQGEWVVDSEHCWVEGSWAINMGDHDCAATVVTCMEGGELNASERKRLEANAHLIASAPKMYTEIEKEIDFLVEILNKVAPGSPVSRGISERIMTLDSLLAEARGE